MRLYNGCPDSALQSRMNADDKARKNLEKRGLKATWFPMEAQWHAFQGYKPVGTFSDTLPELDMQHDSH